MSACQIGFGMDIGACLSSLIVLPDWLVPLLPYWPFAAVAVGAGLAWRLAGAPGLAAFAAAVGFILGRRSAEVHEHVQGKDAAPPVPVKKKRPTILGR